jgi:AAA domain
VRPVRLEVAGFTVFREPMVVDFTGADLFALVGATGAGKTSIIDAVTFALYGCIPRLDDKRAVAPVISQNLTEARVRLDFTVEGRAYTAVRVVRATKAGGATTKEARLEQAGEVLAGTAKEVTDEVTTLLGLTFEHFITCVSLPQGQFARFLHDEPRDRQDLLVRLLDLGLYERVAGVSRQRAISARTAAELAAGQLERLVGRPPRPGPRPRRRSRSWRGWRTGWRPSDPRWTKRRPPSPGSRPGPRRLRPSCACSTPWSCPTGRISWRRTSPARPRPRPAAPSWERRPARRCSRARPG